MCSFAVSETSGSATVMLLVWVAVDPSTETLSRAAAAFGSRRFVFAVIAPPEVVTFQRPKATFIGPPVAVLFASVGPGGSSCRRG